MSKCHSRFWLSPILADGMDGSAVTRRLNPGISGIAFISDTDMTEWFVDHRGDLRADAIHHDGTNHYLYRVYKDEATDSQRETLKRKIYDNKATRSDITKVTRRLGDEIARVYGFQIPRKSRSVER